MYRMSIITMLAPKSLASRIDVSRCTKMALIHDMAESLVGDITPKDNVPKNEKNRRESETMDYLTEYLLGTIAGGGTEVGIDIREIWQEYEDNETLEAKFVHDVDKLELLLQMVEYEKQKSDPEKPESKLDLGEFSWVAKKIELPEVKAWCVEVLREREQYWKQLGIRASALDFGRTIVDHLDA
ncbi:hypothetical protein MMC19_005248 [Ptychographa xylographoides]|nr:hypothetical protein [Ptychographa xylographoides]